MTYRVGTRIKRVRGDVNIGNTGIVVSHDSRFLEGTDKDIFVRQDQPWMNAKKMMCPAGTISMSRSNQWEPIIPDGHKPCEEGFSLDALLSKEVIA